MPNQLFLALNARGAEVKELHDSLRKLGFRIPENETEGKAFGVGTPEALRRFHKKYGLSITGVAEDATKLALSNVDDAEPHLGQGFSPAGSPVPAEMENIP